MYNNNSYLEIVAAAAENSMYSHAAVEEIKAQYDLDRVSRKEQRQFEVYVYIMYVCKSFMQCVCVPKQLGHWLSY